MKKRKPLALLLSIAIVLSMLPTAIYAYASEAHVDHCICGGSVTTGDHTHTATPTWTAWDGASDITYTDNAAYVYLTANATLSSTLTVTGGNILNLCLNGKTLSRSYTVIKVEGDATLNICDCQGGGEIKSTSGSAVSVETLSTGGANTTLNLYSGRLSASKSYTVNLYNGSWSGSLAAIFNMYGGEVYNSADWHYFAVGIQKSGDGLYEINVYGGNITSVNNCGISVWMASNAKTLIAGGTITGDDNAMEVIGNLTLSGSPVITHTGSDGSDIDITTTNVAETKNDYINITDDFALVGGTTISVDKPIDETTDSAVIAKPMTSGNSLSTKAQYFVSSDEGYFVECNTDGNLQLTACKITEQPAESNGYTVTVNGSSNKAAYQWYNAISGNVSVTDKNAAATNNFAYNDSWDKWSSRYFPDSTDPVTLEVFTLKMAEGDVLTVKYSDYSYDDSQGTINGFTLSGNGSSVTGVVGQDSYYKTYTFTVPADGNYTLTADATPGSSTYDGETYYDLYCYFSATVTADVADMSNPLSGQTAVALDTAGLGNGKYICAVTWENKTTLYSDSVEFAAHTHCVCGSDEACGTEHDGAALWTGIAGLSAITEGGNYYLTQDVTLTDTWVCRINGVNLCLNGKTITGASGQNVITVSSDKTLTITDCQTTAGKITHNSGETGRGIENNGTLTLWNGSITGNTGSGYGIGVYNKGTFTMHDGEITGNVGTGGFSGGGIYNADGKNFAMVGGSIANNKSSYGGGVCNYGTFDMSGGSITDNSTDIGNTGSGGGVFNAGTFNISGKVTITNNTNSKGVKNNSYLYSGNALAVKGELDGASRVGITVTNPSLFIGGVVIIGSEDMDIFVSDIDDYYLTANDSGLTLTNTVTVTFDPCGGKVDPSSKTVTYNAAYGELPTPTLDNCVFEGWYTAEVGGEKVESNTIANAKGSVTLYAHWSPVMYTVTIPERAELGKTVTVTAEGVYVASDSCLTVKLTDTEGFMLTNAENATLSYYINSSDTKLSVNDTILSVSGGIKDNSGSAELEFAAAEPIKFSGDYAGTVVFTISIEKGTNQ